MSASKNAHMQIRKCEREEKGGKKKKTERARERKKDDAKEKRRVKTQSRNGWLRST